MFIPWHTMGGTQRGLSYQEIVSMPAAHRHDFSYVMGIISDEREVMERYKPKKPKPGKRR